MFFLRVRHLSTRRLGPGYPEYHPYHRGKPVTYTVWMPKFTNQQNQPWFIFLAECERQHRVVSSEITWPNFISPFRMATLLLNLSSIECDNQKRTMASEGSEKSLSNGYGYSDQNGTRNKHRYHYSQFSVAGSPTTSTAAQLEESNDTDRKKISCNSCRQRKVKCDRGNPCNQCASSFYGTVEIPSWEN